MIMSLAIWRHADTTVVVTITQVYTEEQMCFTNIVQGKIIEQHKLQAYN